MIAQILKATPLDILIILESYLRRVAPTFARPVVLALQLEIVNRVVGGIAESAAARIRAATIYGVRDVQEHREREELRSVCNARGSDVLS